MGSSQKGGAEASASLASP